MTHRRTSLVALPLLAALVVAGCSGDADGGDGGGEDATAACAPGDGAALRTLVDDRSALPADNWLPVLATRDGFRDTLALLDQASRGFSAEDLDAVLAAASGEARQAALTTATADVPEAPGGAGGAGGAGVVRLLVPESATAMGVGTYYRAALERQGARVTIERVADVGAGLDAVAGDDRAAAPVVVTSLSELAGAVGAEPPEGADASARVQAVATAALERDLALGSTAAATDGAQVLVPDALVSAKSLVTLSDLAQACDGAVVAVAGDDQAAAEAVAEAYGFDLGPTVETPADAFADGGDGAVAVITPAT